MGTKETVKASGGRLKLRVHGSHNTSIQKSMLIVSGIGENLKRVKYGTKKPRGETKIERVKVDSLVRALLRTESRRDVKGMKSIVLPLGMRPCQNSKQGQ